MSTKPKSSFMAALSRFFTLKTEQDMFEEDVEARILERKLSTPHGIRSVIDDRQKAVDQYAAKVDGFLKDIEKYFGKDAVYLSADWPGRSKGQDMDSVGTRRFAIKWKDYDEDEMITSTVAFVYTATLDDGVRIDFISTQVGGEVFETINDNYRDASDDVYKNQTRVDDTSRAVRRYKDHAAFVNSNDKPPAWFGQHIRERISPLPTNASVRT